MSVLKDAPTEKRARTQPLKNFNAAITALEDRIEENQLDEEIEAAKNAVLETFGIVQSLH